MRTRYLRDPLPMRLGNLASSLARLATCVEHSRSWNSVAGILDESLQFIQWTMPAAAPEPQVLLADVQKELIRWKLERGLEGDAEATRALADNG